MKSTKTAIFLHGGAIKGAFGAGVLYELAKIGITKADLVIGASSGMPTSAYFVSGQYEAIRDIWTKKIATRDFVKIEDVLAGRPVFNLGYLLGEVFQKQYPLDVAKLLASTTEWRVPLCNYSNKTIEFFSNHGDELRHNFWDIFHAAITLHDRQILWGTPWEKYVDADLDPFALYRQELVPSDWNVLVIGNHHSLAHTLRKELGLRLFLSLQARHFPKHIVEMLKDRPNLIASGLTQFEQFKTTHSPLVILPPQSAALGPLSVIQGSNRKLGYLFAAGQEAVKQNRHKLESFVRRSSQI